ncbi:hypothetical protein ACTOB_002201 [Actinoplanes oblitus]|uniref:HPt domain-containing protein n=1 Tax=Actinoplanes oblitus TaxID=3040509 RepID=A0ABY8WME0_9ACTN|nr:hypothetical protein [Actinoplanes oblitus]WIM98597.1 hypothetical protein ACTOB_002201 [Actinoplanes oblitus]
MNTQDQATSTMIEQPDSTSQPMTAAEALEFLTPDLQEFLVDLHGSPESIAQAAVQLLPFGSRAALQATGLVTADGARCGTDTDTSLRLTELAFEAMAVAADRAETEELDELTARAAAIMAERHPR